MALSEDFWVEKSNALVLAQYIDYDVTALRILDVYLSKINARDENTKTVDFTKQEFCRLMNLHPKTKTKAIVDALNTLQTSKVAFPRKEEGKEGIQIAVLFPNSFTYYEEKTGDLHISLECNDSVRDRFFNVENGGYIRYLIKNITQMNSAYSMRLYNRFKFQYYAENPWTVNISELKKAMGMSEKENKDMRNFRKVIDRCISEINRHTDTEAAYELLRKGSTVTGFVFTITEKADPAAAVIPAEDVQQQPNRYEKCISFLRGAVDNEFTSEQVTVLTTYLERYYDISPEMNELEIYNMLRMIYEEVRADKRIKDRYAYVNYPPAKASGLVTPR